MWLCRVLAGVPTPAPQPCDPPLNFGHASSQPTQLSENTYRIRHLNKGMASAGRPPSLPVVATVSGKSLTLPLNTIRKHAFHTSAVLHLCRPSLAALNMEKLIS